MMWRVVTNKKLNWISVCIEKFEDSGSDKNE